MKLSLGDTDGQDDSSLTGGEDNYRGVNNTMCNDSMMNSFDGGL